MSRSVGYMRALKILERFGAGDDSQSLGSYEDGGDIKGDNSDERESTTMNASFGRPTFDPAGWLPREAGPISNHQTDLPRIAKDKRATKAI